MVFARGFNIVSTMIVSLGDPLVPCLVSRLFVGPCYVFGQCLKEGFALPLSVVSMRVFGFVSILEALLLPWSIFRLFLSLLNHRQRLQCLFWHFDVGLVLDNMARGEGKSVEARKRKVGAMEDRPSTSKEPLLSSRAAKDTWEAEKLFKEKLFKGKLPIEAKREVEELEKEV